MRVPVIDVPRPSNDQQFVAIAALVAAQGLDLATTLYGLRAAEIVELNPIAAAAMAGLGRVPGLLCLACLTVLAAIAITETATYRYGDAWLSSEHVRWLGYAPHVAISVAAALNNVVVASVV